MTHTNGTKPQRKKIDSDSYTLGSKDGRSQAFIDALEITKKETSRVAIIAALKKELDKCE